MKTSAWSSGQAASAALRMLWKFYSGKSGIGRFVQTSFLFYGGLTTFFLAFFAIRFNVFDGTLGRTLVATCPTSALGSFQAARFCSGCTDFGCCPIGGSFDDGATGRAGYRMARCRYREIPEVIVYRDPRGTFTRSVTITFGVAVFLMFVVRGKTTLAVPYYGVGVFMPSWSWIGNSAAYPSTLQGAVRWWAAWAPG